MIRYLFGRSSRRATGQLNFSIEVNNFDCEVLNFLGGGGVLGGSIHTPPFLITYFMIFFYRFMPESIQWLHEKGKMVELLFTLRRIASWNGKKFPTNVIIIPVKKELQRKTRPTDIFGTREIATKSLAQGVLWCTSALGFYGLLLAVDQLGGSVYSNFALLNVADLVAVIISPFICSRFGRKRSSIVAMFFSGLICILLAVIPFESVLVRITCGMLGKVCIGISFNIIYVWSGEIYPTRVRAEGIGWCEVCAKIGSAAAPWIGNFAARLGQWVPFTTMGVLLILGSICGFHLPETRISRNEKERNTKNERFVTKLEEKITAHSNNGLDENEV